MIEMFITTRTVTDGGRKTHEPGTVVSVTASDAAVLMRARCARPAHDEDIPAILAAAYVEPVGRAWPSGYNCTQPAFESE